MAPRPQDRRRVGGGDSAGRNSTFAGAARRDVARIDGVALWRWGGAARGFHRRGPRVRSARPAGFIGAAAKPDTGGPKASTGRRFHGPGADICWRPELKTGAERRGASAQLAEVQPVGHKGRRPLGGSAMAPRKALHRKGLGTAKGAAQEWQHRKGVAPQRRGAPGNDGDGAQAGAPDKRAGSGNRPQRRGPSYPRGQLGPTEQRVLKKRLLRSDYRGNTGSTTRFHEALMTPANDPYQAPIAVAIPRYPPTL